MPIKFRGKTIFDPAGVQVGADGPRIAEILAGSGTIDVASYATGSAGTSNISVTGLSQDHKVFISASQWSACVVVACVSCSPGGGVLKIDWYNSGSETSSCFVGLFSYLAVLDK